MKKRTTGETVETQTDRAESASPEDSKKNAAAKKKSREKQNDAARVHDEIAGIVRASAADIAQVLIDRALDGDLASAKYLFEFARIFPTADEAIANANEEDSLAKTLMHRLNLPEEPLQMEEDEDGKGATSGNDGESAGESDHVTQVGEAKND